MRLPITNYQLPTYNRMADIDLQAQVPPGARMILRARRGWRGIGIGGWDWAEVWRARDLMWTLAGRDLKLRYKQTALGVAWVVLQPLLAAGIFTVVFGKIAKLQSGGVP